MCQWNYHTIKQMSCDGKSLLKVPIPDHFSISARLSATLELWGKDMVTSITQRRYKCPPPPPPPVLIRQPCYGHAPTPQPPFGLMIGRSANGQAPVSPSVLKWECLRSLWWIPSSIKVIEHCNHTVLKWCRVQAMNFTFLWTPSWLKVH